MGSSFDVEASYFVLEAKEFSSGAEKKHSPHEDQDS